MNVTQFLRTEQLANQAKLAVTATATLTYAQLGAYKSFIASDAVAITLPAASAALNGLVRRICAGGASATVVVAAGFAGNSGSSDVVTLGIGDYAEVFCNGTYWFVNSVTTAA